MAQVDKKKRDRPSQEQLNVLLNFIDQNSSLVPGIITPNNLQLWQDLSLALSEVPDGIQGRPLKGWVQSEILTSSFQILNKSIKVGFSNLTNTISLNSRARNHVYLKDELNVKPKVEENYNLEDEDTLPFNPANSEVTYTYEQL